MSKPKKLSFLGLTTSKYRNFMAELGMFGCLLNVHIDLQNSFETYFLYFHDIKIDLRPKNKETFFLYHTYAFHSAL